MLVQLPHGTWAPPGLLPSRVRYGMPASVSLQEWFSSMITSSFWVSARVAALDGCGAVAVDGTLRPREGGRVWRWGWPVEHAARIAVVATRASTPRIEVGQCMVDRALPGRRCPAIVVA